MKYIVFNKALDYRRGYGSNISYEDGLLKVEDVQSGEPGMFFSRTLDSKEQENIWHRMVVESEIGENMAAYFYFYATDSQWEVNGIEEKWKKGDFSFKEKMEVRNPKDILLHQVKGRFLWIGIVLWGNGVGSPVIKMIQLYVTKETWNKYLPEIYQGGRHEFLERYLGIFQSLYQDMERRIRKNTMSLDIQAVDDQMLLWLAEWIYTENSHLWKPERLRAYLANGAALYSIRGTAYGLIRMVELYTGEKPYIVEPGEGDTPHCFSLLLREEAVPDGRAYEALKQIIRAGKPADMEVQLILLKPYLFLDNRTYLGINSVLKEYGEAVLDQNSALDYAVLAGGNDI